MAQARFKSVDEYLGSQPEGSRAVLNRVRGALRKALPKAEESIAYNIPVYKVNGRAVIYFAGWKKHYSLYPVTAVVVAELAQELESHEIEKGTIRFPWTGTPVGLIQRIAKLRAKEAARRGT